ncbi:MAG TPA: hypothetical protein VHL34_17285 [Rhizomicrobium sp.]|jgi:hypothetical protein|nr:hypothetical protein [Rhizomicrobium sp.]
MRATVASVLAVSLLGPLAPAHADSAAQIADIRCAIVSMNLPKEEGEAAPTAAMISVMFFLGRIEGRDPHYDVKAAIGAQMAVMTPSDRATESKRCITEMLEKGKAAEQLGLDLLNQGHVEVRPM